MDALALIHLILEHRVVRTDKRKQLRVVLPLRDGFSSKSPDPSPVISLR